MVHILDITPFRESSPQNRSGIARVLKGSHSFTWILWNGEVMHGAISSIQKCQIMSIASGKSLPIYLYNIIWSRIVQCPDSQVSWDHSYR